MLTVGLELQRHHATFVVLDDISVPCQVTTTMDAAERRFRACVDRLKRDLTQIVFRSIDGMVDEALREARAAEMSEPEDVPAAAHSANGSSRRRKGTARVSTAARTGEPSNGLDGTGTSLTAEDLAAVARASQLELELDLDLLRPKRKSAPPRVRPDSVLGAELASQADGAEQRAREPAGVLPAREPAPARAPTDRPLFVHKRARDGQIHALRRVREGTGTGAESRVESRPDASAAERG